MRKPPRDEAAAHHRFAAVFAHLAAVAAYARRRGALDAEAVAAEVMTIAWRRLADVPRDDARHAWECYWVHAIRSENVTGQRRAHAELEKLLANNMLVAPTGAPEDWAPSPEPKVPYAIWANDGGLQCVRAAYSAAAAGKPKQLIQSCRADGG